MNAHRQRTSTRPRRPGHPPGFSLTELLVVIGIIVLLVGLLLVALGSVRERALRGSTEATMRSFAQACEAFQADHGFYPGVIPERVLQQNPGVMTSMENALIQLMGGYRVLTPTDVPGSQAEIEFDDFGGQLISLDDGNGQWQLKVDRARIGEGPLVDGKPYAPYYTPGGDEIRAAKGQWTIGGDDSLQWPDLIDGWGQPIMYLRRLRTIGPLAGRISDNPPPQFVDNGLEGYLGSDGLGDLNKEQATQCVLNIGNLNERNTSLGQILAHPALDGEARGAFLLVSAGPDGVYFSVRDGIGSPSAPIEDGGPTLQDLHDAGAKIIDEFDDIRVFGGG